MPEITDVRKYADFIKKNATKKIIKKIKIIGGRYKKHGISENFTNLKKNLPLSIINVKTKGKFTYIYLSNGNYIFVTLGLFGGWTIRKMENNQEKYDFPFFLNYMLKEKKEKYLHNAIKHINIEFVFDDNTFLCFYDMLSFGTITIITEKNILNKKLAEIGEDIMDKETTFEIFKKKIKKTKNLEKQIGVVLLNQKIISGVGNYLRSSK